MYGINTFYQQFGLNDIIDSIIPWKESEFDGLIKYAKQIRRRYSIFNKVEKDSCISDDESYKWGG